MTIVTFNAAHLPAGRTLMHPPNRNTYTVMCNSVPRDDVLRHLTRCGYAVVPHRLDAKRVLVKRMPRANFAIRPRALAIGWGTGRGEL